MKSSYVALLTSGDLIGLRKAYFEDEVFNAIENGDADSLKSMFEWEVDLNLKNRGGDFILHCLTKSIPGEKGAELLAQAIQRGANPEVEDRHRMTPLMLAANAGQMGHVRSLLQTGSRVNPPMGAVTSALIQAVKFPEIVELILDHGADPNLKDRSGRNPLYNAVQSDNFYSAEMLIARGARPDQAEGLQLLIYAVRLKNEPLVKLLIKEGISVNGLDEEGKSPLYHAVDRYAVKMTKLLLKMGADPNLKGALGTGPLTNAICGEKPSHGTPSRSSSDWEKSQNLARILLDAGADPNADIDPQGNTIVHQVAKGNLRWGDTLLRMLVARGGDLGKPNQEGRSPHDLAQASGKFKPAFLSSLVRSALELGADESPDNDEEDPGLSL